MLPASSRNVWLLFFTLVVVMMGFGLAIPILPYYIDSFGASGSALGLLMALYAILQFLFAPVWGSLSDRVGRKPILLAGVFGNALALLLFGLANQLWMLFAARALAGILSSATLPTAMAYIGDSTSEENRGGGMGILGAAMGVGMVIGPGAGGWLAGRSLSLPFYVAAALSMLAFVAVAALLPESLPPEQREAGAVSSAVQGPQVRAMWQALSGPVGILLVLAFLLSFGLTNFETVFGFYTLERFGYGPQTVGMVLMSIGVASAVVQGMLTGPLTRRFGEAAVIRASLIGSAIAFLLLLAARDFAGVMITSCLFAISNAMLRPGISSLISTRATTGQGVAMGLNNAFMSLGRMVGPVWAGLVFDVDIRLPYVSGAAVMAAGFVVSLVWLSGQPRQAAERTSTAERSTL